MYFAYCRYFDALLCVNSFSFLSGLAFQFFLFSIHYIVYLFFYNHSLSTLAILYATSRNTLRYIPHDSTLHPARLYATFRTTLRYTPRYIPQYSTRDSMQHSVRLYATFRATFRATLCNFPRNIPRDSIYVWVGFEKNIGVFVYYNIYFFYSF